MAATRALLADTLELVFQRDAEFPVLFYELLFARHPETRPLFKSNSLGAQRKMLGQALMAIVDHLEDPAWLDETLVPMGRDHAGYGVTAPMYEWVGECLIEAIARVAAGDWTPAHAAAWQDAYAEISRRMQAGAASAR